MGCFVAILLFLALILGVNYPVPTLIVVAIVVVFGVIFTKKGKKETQEKLLRYKEFEEDVLKKFGNIKSDISIPENALKVTYKKGYADLLNTENFVWIDNNNLCFFPANPPNYLLTTHFEKVILYKIPINNIEYYAIRGEIVRENKITGGGGGGSSISGAVVGGVLAGGAGAVIGSRKKSDPIKSELVTHDTRETFLNFFDDKKVKHSMFFNFKDHSVFSELMPEKSFEIVNAIKSNVIINKALNDKQTMGITEQIRELAKLKEEGILSEEEFSEKKKLLLDKIV